jgi:glutamate racemase
MSTPSLHTPPIGIFDSGVGGLTILRAVRLACPDCPTIYVADSANAPYGDREIQHTLNRSQIIADHLVAQGVRMLVVACNTATALAIEHLRARFPDIALVGVEPGVKPAVAHSQNRKIGVLATPATVASGRYNRLVALHAPDYTVVTVACPGLAVAIENGHTQRAHTLRLLDEFCHPLTSAGVDTVVLGCTHYALVAQDISARLGPQVHLIDTADAVARQARALQLRSTALTGQNVHQITPPSADLPLTRLFSTGDTGVLERLAIQTLGLHLSAEQLHM